MSNFIIILFVWAICFVINYLTSKATIDNLLTDYQYEILSEQIIRFFLYTVMLIFAPIIFLGYVVPDAFYNTIYWLQDKFNNAEDE